jgi:hypothetical protein
MLGGYWEELLGAWASDPAGLIFLCFFLTALLASVAALAGAIMGTAPNAVATKPSVKRRTANRVMRFSSRLSGSYLLITPIGGKHSRTITPT